ncbi:MAG: LacI family transcriptional regulator [Lentisphaerae bacterium]|nr:LacI family transcriptional regulator [Lentisphaerota bacterium]
MPVTIKDIALRANVSYQAVSAVLNNKTNCRVSPQKREHIHNIARELGYQVNFGYKLMHGHSTHTVAIVSAMRQIDSEEHIQKMLLKLIRQMNLMGFSTYFKNMTANAEENIRQIRELVTRGAEHFVFIGTPFGHAEIESELSKSQRTFIGWNSLFSRNLKADSVEASFKLLSFLKEQSGENPLLILPGKKSVSSARFEALQQLIDDQTVDDILKKNVIFTQSLEWDEKDFEAKAFELGYTGTEMAFAGEHKPRAIAYFTDGFAMGGACWCQQHDLIIGKDIFLSGFNNIDAVRFNAFPIASAAHPIDRSIEIILQQMNKTEPFETTLQLDVFLRDINNHPFQKTRR